MAKRKDITKKGMTERQKLFIEYYTNPKSNTFQKCAQSGVKAGFPHSYAKDILFRKPSWLADSFDIIADEKRLKKAEMNFDEYQNLDIKNGGDKIDPAILANKMKVDFFLSERLDKAKYSTRTENAVLVKVEHTIDEETKKRLDALL